MDKCWGCKYYDSSVDCCNCDDYCYMDGIEKGIEEGIEMSAFAFGYIYDGECERCPAESECEYGKPCIETLKEYIKKINSNKESIEARRRIWGTK